MKRDESLEVDMRKRKRDGQKKLVMSQFDSLDFYEGRKVKFQHKIGLWMATSIRFPFISDALCNNHENSRVEKKTSFWQREPIFNRDLRENVKPDVVGGFRAMPLRYNDNNQHIK